MLQTQHWSHWVGVRDLGVQHPLGAGTHLEQSCVCASHALHRCPLLLGACSIAEMLFGTSLVTFVGTGEQPALTPRKMTVYNTSSDAPIQDLNFVSSVLAVRMNRQRWDHKLLQ